MLWSLAFLFILNNILFDSIRLRLEENLEFVCSKLTSCEFLVTILVKTLDNMLDKLLL